MYTEDSNYDMVICVLFCLIAMAAVFCWCTGFNPTLLGE